MQVQLVMFKADGQRREFTLRKTVTIIGRATECDFQIPIPAVSRKHCQITVREDHIAIKDLGSSNGTFVNDQRMQEADLEPGDKLAVGPVTFTIVVDGQPADIAAVRTIARPNSSDEFELDGGTVDVEAQQEPRPGSSVKPPVKPPAPQRQTPIAPAAAHEQLEELEELEELHEIATPAQPIDEVEVMDEVDIIEDTEEIEEIEEVQEITGNAPAPKNNNHHPHPADEDDPLSALAAMAQPKTPRS